MNTEARIQNAHQNGYYLESTLLCYLYCMRGLNLIFKSCNLTVASEKGIKLKKLYEILQDAHLNQPLIQYSLNKKNLKSIKVWLNAIQKLLNGKASVRHYKTLSEHSIKILALVNMAVVKTQSNQKSRINH